MSEVTNNDNLKETNEDQVIDQANTAQQFSNYKETNNVETFNVLRHKWKDNMFHSIFSKQENLVKLGRELVSDRKDIAPENVKNITITTDFIRDFYNDLGFSIQKDGENTLIGLVEAQSMWHVNILIRMFYYIHGTLRSYFDKNDLDITENKFIPMPEIRLYLVYTGSDRKDVPEILYSKEVYNHSDYVDFTFKIHVLKEETAETFLGQYIGFCKIFNRYREKYPNDKMKCIKETVSEAFQKGYLPDYFLDHKDEVQKMLDSEFDIQYLYNKFVNSIAAETREEERKKADEHYLTAIINNKAMTIDAYCSCFNISENEIKELGYDALQKGLITKDSASTFFELPIDEVESQLKSFQNLH